MVMNDEFETRKGKLKQGKKLNHNTQIDAQGYTGTCSVYKGIAMLWYNSIHGLKFQVPLFQTQHQKLPYPKTRKSTFKPKGI